MVYIILVPSGDHTANTEAKTFMINIMAYIEASTCLHSDRGQEVTSEIWHELQEILDC